MHAQTARQREVLDFIIRYIESHGYRPSYQLIANRLGLNSRAGIGRIVRDLEVQGLLTRRREDGHFYIDLGKADQTVAIFWLDVPGENSSEKEHRNASISLPEFMLGGYAAAAVRVFRVFDDSLANEHICADDIALVELREFARDGQIIVAVVDNHRTVFGKYYRAGADIEIRSDAEVSIKVAANSVKIMGICRGIIRPMI